MSLQKCLEAVNKFFDHIYLVSIPRSWEQRQFRAEHNLHGLNYTFFSGCDGRALAPEQVTSIADLEKARKFLEYYHLLRYGEAPQRTLTLSELGCSESHRMVYRDILNNKYSRVLILEDDAMLWRAGLISFPNMVRQLPSQWDLWYLGYRWHDCESLLARLKRKALLFLKTCFNPENARKDRKMQKLKYPVPFRKNIWKAGLHAGTHAYAITRNAAEILLRENTPIYLPADLALAHLHLQSVLKAYISVPQVFREDQSFETTVLNQ